MIRVTPAPEPAGFDVAVRQPGLRALAEMVGESPVPSRRRGRPYQKIADHRDRIPAKLFPALWTEALDDMMNAYQEICAYSCFRIHTVTGAQTVDHMAPKSRAWNQAYEWANYRLASSRLNASKNNFADVLDPFLVQDDWFELELVGFQVTPAKHLDDATRAQIQATIDRLGLNRFCARREGEAEDYWQGDISFRILQRESPFVARELKRQGRLLPKDL